MSRVVIRTASFLALQMVLLAADSVASAVLVEQPSVGVLRVDPSLEVATLVSGSNAENIATDFERAVATNLPLTVSVRRLDEFHIRRPILLERFLHTTAPKSRVGSAGSCGRTLLRSCYRAVCHHRFSCATQHR